jgi:hypothetical protein
MEFAEFGLQSRMRIWPQSELPATERRVNFVIIFDRAAHGCRLSCSSWWLDHPSLRRDDGVMLPSPVSHKVKHPLLFRSKVKIAVRNDDLVFLRFRPRNDNLFQSDPAGSVVQIYPSLFSYH